MDEYLTSFLLGFSTMFVLHHFAEMTYGLNEPKPNPVRLIVHYALGTLGIAVSFLHLHPELWLDVVVSISGAGIATVLAHGTDFVAHLIKKDRAHGLIEKSKDRA